VNVILCVVLYYDDERGSAVTCGEFGRLVGSAVVAVVAFVAFVDLLDFGVELPQVTAAAVTSRATPAHRMVATCIPALPT
jgi:hypothetical protein